MVTWNQSKVLIWVQTAMSTENGFSAASMNQFRSACATNGLDGNALAQLRNYELEKLGVSIGDWARMLDLIAANVLQILPGEMPTGDPCSSFFGQQLPVYVDYYMTALTGVDDRLYTFEKIFFFNLVWSDDRHQYFPPTSKETAAACKTQNFNGASVCLDSLWGLGGTDMFEKGMFFLNSKEVVKVQPTDYYAGAGMPFVPHVCYEQNLFRASFTIDMTFARFPFDKQALLLKMGWPEGVDLKPGKQMRATTKFEDAPGWEIEELKVIRTSIDFANGDEFLPKGQIYPLDHPFRGFPNVPSPMLYFVIVVERLWSFYLINIVVPICMLNILSWTSFALSPSAIDVRLATTMTILLALIAFQIIINDALPKTGQLTRMHIFILVSNIMIVLAGLESMAVYYLVENDIGSGEVLRKMICRRRSCRTGGGRGKGRGVGNRQGGGDGASGAGANRTDGASSVDGVNVADGASADGTVQHRVVQFGDVHDALAASSDKSVGADTLGGKAPVDCIEQAVIPRDPTVAAHDGEVTEVEIRNIHRIDKACLVLFPLVYTILCAVCLRP
jgi:hypothetical protein